MNVFNPKILDASIRDVSASLSDNQKVDLLLYAMRCLQFEGYASLHFVTPVRLTLHLARRRSRTIIENAIQSCLQVSTLSPETTAKARILRARSRLANGLNVGAHEGTYIHSLLFTSALTS